MSDTYNFLFLTCYFFIAIAVATGIIKYKYIDSAMRIIAILLIVTLISESFCYVFAIKKKYTIRYSIYHFYNIVQAFLMTVYFIYGLNLSRYRVFLIASAIFWVVAGIANAVFLQPITELNSNMLLLESFSFITMSLYFIYRTLKNDMVEDIFRYAHFRMALIFLVYWGFTLFFWGCIKILYREHWKYMETLMYIQTFIEILTYVGMAFTLYYSDKKKKIDTQH